MQKSTKIAAASAQFLPSVIVLFRNDLRVHDNEALASANKYCFSSNSDTLTLQKCHLIPLYCMDPMQLSAGTHYFSFKRYQECKLAFLLESLADLKQTFQTKYASDLIIRYGKPENVIAELIEKVGNVVSVFMQKESSFEEIQVEKSLQSICGPRKIPIHYSWSSTVFHLDDIPFVKEQIPEVFTQFRKAVEQKCSVRNEFTTPIKLASLPSGLLSEMIPSNSREMSLEFEKALGASSAQTLAVMSLDFSVPFLKKFRGGETAALARLAYYLWESDKIQIYKQTRDGLMGMDYSSKLSPWLALGCISPRFIAHEIQRYERERVQNESTYWLFFELLWRDYFKLLPLKHGVKLFTLGGILSKKSTSQKGQSKHVYGEELMWSQDENIFTKWKEGRTGIPFIDANMRELLQTGFMSNRGRQNVASFLTKDLLIDWRMGAEWFEGCLLDHDPGSNYGNWQYVAGVGTDPRENRKFNIIKQAHQYDPTGEYVKLWCPELCSIPAHLVHTPWIMSEQEQQRFGCTLGKDYPEPMVEAIEWKQFYHTNSNFKSNSSSYPLPFSSTNRGPKKPRIPKLQ